MLRLALLLLGFSCSLAAAASSDVESIKALLQNPPQLEHFLYEVTANQEFYTAKHGAHGFCKGRWHDASAYWAQNYDSRTADALPAATFSQGRFGSTFWEAHNADLTMFDSALNPRRADTQPPQPVCFMASVAEQYALRVLRLGLPEIDFPRATWSGLAFAARAVRAPFTPDEAFYPAGGAIAEVAPRQFEISVTNRETGTLEMRALLKYDRPPAENPFPATIERYDDLKKVMRPPPAASAGLNKILTVRLLEVRTSSNSLPNSLLNPTLLTDLPRRRMFFYSNDVLYGISPFKGNEVERILSAEETRALHSRPDYTRPILLSVLFAFMILALGWTARLRMDMCKPCGRRLGRCRSITIRCTEPSTPGSRTP